MSRAPRDWLRDAERRLWDTPQGEASAPAGRGVRAVRLAYVLARDLVSGSLNLRAMSLVYTTLLAMVPLLALSFSVLKAFGVHNQVEPLLANVLAPLGPEGHELAVHIIGFVEQMNVGVLGSIGLALLLYSSVSLMQKIEASFNYIWHVDTLRSMSDRFSRYLTVMLVGPFMVFAALGITTAVMSSAAVGHLLEVEPLGRIAFFAGRAAPYLLVIAAFTLLYVFIPNTRVAFKAAFAAACVAGVLWQTAGWIFAIFVASSSHYAAIYSGFAILVLFMIWLYMSWLILLFGASIAFYLQHPAYVVALPGEPRLSNRMRERLAFAIMGLAVEQHRSGAQPWTAERLTERLGVPMHTLQVVLDALHRGGVLARVEGEPAGYLPARDPKRVSLGEMLALVRSAGEDRFLSPETLHVPARVEQVLARMQRGIDASLDELTIDALADDPAPSGGESAPQEDAHRPVAASMRGSTSGP